MVYLQMRQRPAVGGMGGYAEECLQPGTFAANYTHGVSLLIKANDKHYGIGTTGASLPPGADNPDHRGAVDL